MAWDWGTAGAGAGTGALVGNMIVPGFGAVGGAGIGALAGLFGGKKSYDTGDDPLAAIRLQLQQLASGVPAITAQRANDIKNSYANARTRGLQGIQDQLYAERGLGKTSIEPMYNLDLLTNLSSEEQNALTQNELSGLQEEAGILQGAGGLAGQEQPDQPSIWAKLLGKGADIGGNMLGKSWMNTDNINKLKDYLNPSASGASPDWLEKIIQLPAAVGLPNMQGGYTSPKFGYGG